MAVAGMICAARFSGRACGLAPSAAARLTALVAGAGLPTTPPKIAAERWLELTRDDKKVGAVRLRLITLRALFQARIAFDVILTDVEVTLAVFVTR